MEKPEEIKIQHEMAQKVDKPLDPEKVKIVPVEELIPGIKPRIESQEKQVRAHGNQFDDQILTDALSGPNFRVMILNSFFELGGKQEIDILRERFENKVLVDLGAGDNTYGYFLAQFLGASGYIGVEPTHFLELHSYLKEYDVKQFISQFDYILTRYERSKVPLSESSPEIAQKTKSLYRDVPVAIVNEDMLSFLKRLPSDSTNIIAFGIYNELIPDSYYLEKVGEEIKRALAINGVLISESSPLLSKDLPTLYNQIMADEPSFKQQGNMPDLLKNRTTGFYTKKS